MAEKDCRKFQPAKWDAQTLQTTDTKTDRQTDDRRICDSIYPNVTYSHVQVKAASETYQLLWCAVLIF